MISVIVPVYKTEAFLKRCVDSILNQTYSNLEVILVDDGSPDGCGSICDEYAKSDPRVKVIHQKNGGVSTARNNGIAHASGSYLAFVDADDWIEPWGYQKLRELMDTYDADIAEASWRFYRPWKPERLYYQGENTGTVKVYSNVEALERLYFGPQLFSDISISPCTKLYRAELFRELRFMEGYRNEDVELIPKLLFYAKKVVKYDDTFYTYNIHLGPDSFSGQGNNYLKTVSHMESRKRVYQFFQEHPLDQISDYTMAAYGYSMVHSYNLARELHTPEGKKLAGSIIKDFRRLYPKLHRNPKRIAPATLLLFYISPSALYLSKKVQKWLQNRRKK